MPALLLRYRVALGIFILGLALSGITAFPLLHELELLSRLLGIASDAVPASLSGLPFWIATVRDGLRGRFSARAHLRADPRHPVFLAADRLQLRPLRGCSAWVLPPSHPPYEKIPA